MSCRWTADSTTSAGRKFLLVATVGAISTVGFGGGYSEERDYRSITANGNIAQNFNMNNTTVSLTANFEVRLVLSLWRRSSAAHPDGRAMEKPVEPQQDADGFFLGVTEVMTRNWLTQLNYS